MSVTLSMHHCHKIVASTTATYGAPLKLSFTGDSAMIPHEITIFTDDQLLTDRLIEVINDVMERRAEEVQARVTEAMKDDVDA